METSATNPTTCGRPRRRLAFLLALSLAVGVAARGEAATPDVDRAVPRGLDWLASHQARVGRWTANNGRYPTAMTAMAGIALLCEGSTTTQGKYAANIRRAVDYLIDRSRPNGLIGDSDDDRYTYGHGFSMLFLSQILGEEEDAERRRQLVDVLTRAVVFTGQAQTEAGGWGYVSAKDGQGFDEGSTTITQVQGLRGCRNAGIPVPKEIIDKAIHYITVKCMQDDGGVQYNSRGGGGRPAITAAAIACLFNAGQYDNKAIPKMEEYCRKQLDNITNQGFGHWHYAHYYYAQVRYREGGKSWQEYRDKIFARLVQEAGGDGSWNQGYIGPVYTTAINLTILQLDTAALPIYQR
jgi:hypothetical protein